MARLQRWRDWARGLKREVHALALAVRHPQTPWYAKVLAACVVAYAVSPIDLIPDPIPVIGYLDDLVLVPLGIALVRRAVPAAVLAECRLRAAEASAGAGRLGRVAAVVIVLVWLVLLGVLGVGVWHWLRD